MYHYTPTIMLAIVAMGALISKMTAAVKFEIPVGYQDENGFHYGVQPNGANKFNVSSTSAESNTGLANIKLAHNH
jgi:hypothetical protein